MVENNKGPTGLCPKCFKEKELVKHEFFPSRFFLNSGDFLYLCKECSDKLKSILKNKKASETLYFKIQRDFIHSKCKNFFILLEKRTKKTKRKGICPSCLNAMMLEKHHPWPQRDYGRKTPTIFLCSRCHDDMEKSIPKFKKLNEKLCLDLIKSFIRGTEIPRKVKRLLDKEKNESFFKRLSN